MRDLPSDGVASVLTEVARLRRLGREVIPFHVGEPDFGTPTNIVDAGVTALRSGATHYTPVLGLPELRDAVVAEVARSRGLTVRPDQVVVTPGAKTAIHLLAMALCDPGDEVVCIEPAYGAYAALARLAGARVLTLAQRIEDGWRLDLDRLDDLVTDRTRILFVNSPANPTGHVLDDEELRGLARVAERRPGLVVVSDEIYGRITYEASSASPAAIAGMAERTAIVDGVSKTYAMTGWRLGYAVLPGRLAEDVARLAFHTYFCVSAVAQWAAVEALCGPQESVDQMVAAYWHRRDMMVKGINAIPGMRCLAPDGAFYAYVDARALGLDSLGLSLRLLAEGGVASYPGTAFGASGEGFIRLSFATSEECIRTGLGRIAEVVRGLDR